MVSTFSIEQLRISPPSKDTNAEGEANTFLTPSRGGRRSLERMLFLCTIVRYGVQMPRAALCAYRTVRNDIVESAIHGCGRVVLAAASDYAWRWSVKFVWWFRLSAE
jgi:hypothetical protein